jgi:hypothetical protein
VQADIFSFVDDTHATVTEFLEDAVVGNGFANHGNGEILSCRILGRVPSEVKVSVEVVEVAAPEGNASRFREELWPRLPYFGNLRFAVHR